MIIVEFLNFQIVISTFKWPWCPHVLLNTGLDAHTSGV